MDSHLYNLGTEERPCLVDPLEIVFADQNCIVLRNGERLERYFEAIRIAKLSSICDTAVSAIPANAG